jgi:hypothetical protein
VSEEASRTTDGAAAIDVLDACGKVVKRVGSAILSVLAVAFDCI